MSWLGHAKVSFHTHPSSLSLPSKPPSSQSISFLDLCKSSIPPCRLNPFLFNGHLQTMYTVVKSVDIPIYYKRKIFSAEDPSYAGIFAVDFVVPPYESKESVDDGQEQLFLNEGEPLPRTTYYSKEDDDALGSDDEKPMLVSLHGLSGGSHEIYLREVLDLMAKAGWEACVVNARGCAGSQITSGVLFNARATWDVRQVVRWCREKFPNRPLFAVGYSLGANILVNYLGEEGERCELMAAAVCSNPWNLEVGSLSLQRTWLGKDVYSKTMAENMKKLFEKHAEQITNNPAVNLDRMRAVKYLHEFDREVQGPTWGYPTEGAYYRDASSCDSLFAVQVPLLAINARDDPIASDEAIPYEEFKRTPYAVLCTTSLGGHLSWFELGGGRWFAKAITNYFFNMVEKVNLSRLKEMDKPPSWSDGGMGQAFVPMRRRMRLYDQTHEE